MHGLTKLLIWRVEMFLLLIPLANHVTVMLAKWGIFYSCFELVVLTIFICASHQYFK